MVQDALKEKCFKEVGKSAIRALRRFKPMPQKPDTEECVLMAYPNPIPVLGISSVGQTMLKWYGATSHVELRVGAPDGQLFASGGPRGETFTGPWVSDGMTFYLQDVSQGKHQNHETTLAKLTIYLKYQIEVPFLPNHEEIVSNIVLKHTAKRPLVVQTLPVLRGLVCRVRLPDRTIFIKAAPEIDPIAIEAWALHRVREIGVPVPTVLEINQIGEHFAGAYIVLEEVPGLPSNNPLLPAAVLRPALREAGRCLRMIHSIPVEGYGELQLHDGLIVGKHQSYREAIYEEVFNSIKYLEHNMLVDDVTLGWVRMQIDQLDNMQPLPEAKLLHGDLYGCHILISVEQGKLAGIIDFSHPLGGDPFFDLSLYAYANGMEKLAYLLEGYALEQRQKENFERILPFYIMVHSIGFARYGDEQGLEDVKLHALRVLCNMKDAGLSAVYRRE